MNPAQITPQRILAVVHQRPTAFQRLALDALGASGEVQGQLTPIDLPQGRTDGGYDGWLRGRFRGLVGEIRVSVKASGEWDGLRAQHKKDLQRHPGAPVLLICALRLSKDQRERLADLAQQHRVPAQEVVDLGELAVWLRGPALAVALAWLAEPPGPLVPLRYARERGLIAEPAGPTPPLGCEAAAAAALLEAGDAPGGGIVSLRVRPHLDRPQRVIGALAHQIEARGAPRQWWWVRADPAAGDGLRLAAGRVQQDDPGPAFLVDLSDRVPPSAAADLVMGCPNARLILMGSAAQLREAVGAAVHIRPGPPPVALELAQPTGPEMRAWWAAAAPNLSEVRRQMLGDLCLRDPGPAERLLSGGASLKQGVVEALELARAHQLTDRHIAALGWVALRGRWSIPPEAEWTAWLEARTGLSAREQDDALIAAIAAGLLHRPTPDRMVVPRTEALRLGLVWAGQSKARGPGPERLAAAVLEAPEPEQAELLGAALDHFHHSELATHLRAPLRGPDRLKWATWLSQRPCKTPAITRMVLEQLAAAADEQPDHDALRQLVAQAAAVTTGEAVNDGLPALIKYADARRPGLGGKSFEVALAQMFQPGPLPPACAAALADQISGHLEGTGPDVGPWKTAAVRLIGLWLAAGVARVEAAQALANIDTKPWNPKAPNLEIAWQRVADLCATLVQVDPELGWGCVRTLGDAMVGNPQLPPTLFAILSDLLSTLLSAVPPVHAPAERVTVEDALLVVARRPWCDTDLAARIIGARAADPRLLAWRCAKDPLHVVLNPTEAAAQIRAAGVAAWWRAQVTANRGVNRGAPPGLVDALVALHLDGPGAAAVLRDLPATTGCAGSTLVARWASAQPEPFVAMLEAPLWSCLPHPARRRLVQAAWELPDGPLGRAVCKAALAAFDRAANAGGLCAELRVLLDTPAQVEDATAEALITALELALAPPRVAATLQRLATLGGCAARRQLSGWAYRAVLRGMISCEELGRFFDELTAGDRDLEGADPLTLLLLFNADGTTPPAGQVVEAVLLRRLIAWIDRPSPLDSLGHSPSELGGPFTRLMREAPVVWWRWAALLTMPAAPASWLVEAADSAAIEAALDATPVELVRFSSTSQAYDMLTRALSAERFDARVDAALAAGAVAEARRLLLGRGLSVDLIPLFERVILATAEAGEEPRLDWGRRVVGREGQTGYRSTGMISLAPDQELSDLSPEQLDPVGAAIRARLTERSTTAPSPVLRRFYQKLLREMSR